MRAAPPNASPPGAIAGALRQEDFIPLSLRGFGDGWNAYIHSMNWFEGRLYCGTFRANLCLKRRQKLHGPQWPVWPVKCPDDVFRQVDVRAQLWRFDPVSAEWENVLRSPIVRGRDGQDIPRECAYRGLIVFQGKSDPKPALYITPFSNTRSTGPVILRSDDGRSFEAVSKPGLGFDGVSSFRFLTAFRGRVYTSPVGMTNNIANFSSYPVVFESDDPATGAWHPVSPPGFGDPNNSVVFETAAFGDYLYAGTFNHVTGCQIWKTDASGRGIYKWTKVLDLGAFRGNFNEGVLSMCAFRDALYIGTCVQDGGFDRVNRVGPAAGEILRIYPDDSWDLVMGSPRLTPFGLKLPTSGLRPGFDDLFNGYIWRMCVHENRLYVGTMNWSVWLNYVDLRQWPGKLREFVEARGVSEQIGRGGFDLWRTADGDRFEPVTRCGFGTPFNCGARTLVSTPFGLAVGTVNPFGPEVAVRRGRTWKYSGNPRGGGEVWIGSRTFTRPLREMIVPGAVEGSRAEDYRMPPIQERSNPPGFSDATAARSFDITAAALRRRRRDIDVDAVASLYMSEARDLYDLREEGAENVPGSGPVLLLGNNPAIFLLAAGSLIAAHALYTLSVIASLRKRPAWLLASTRYFEPPEQEQISGKLVRSLGIVPRTPANGVRLLEMGEAVLGYPESKPSRPPYGLHRFEPDCVRMAVATRAPIVPVAFIGPHESHLLIETGGGQVLVNKRQPFITDYRIVFLPPVQWADHGLSAKDAAGIEDLCGELRERIRRTLSRLARGRRLVGVSRSLQSRFGSDRVSANGVSK